MTALPQLQADGYCIIDQVFDQTDMDWLRRLCGQALSNVSMNTEKEIVPKAVWF